MSTIIKSRYRLHEKIGQGGMGIVYRATDRLTGQTVALKQITKDLAMMFGTRVSGITPEMLRFALAQEFQILAGLRHPHIVSVLDYGFDAEQNPFFTMNYLAEAETFLAAGQKEDRAGKIELIQQTLQALAYLHRRGILHKDIKPNNILVSNGRVFLVDFGLSATQEQHSAVPGGTMLYMAPEIYEDKQAYSFASDLYSLGIVMYELLEDVHPFFAVTLEEGAHPPEIWQALQLDDLPPLLIDFLQRMLDPQPTNRYRNAQEALTALSKALGQPSPPESREIRESFLQAATFIGRETEINQLTHALSQAQDGQGSAWLIGGESGVGKTRLLREIETKALVNGFLVLRGQAAHSGGGLPYQIWRDALRHLLVIASKVDPLTASVLLPFVPDISRLLERKVTLPPAVEENIAQLRLFTTIARLFQEQTQPILFVVEDLQWAEESLLPLSYLTSQLAGRKLLILGSYRHGERPGLPQQLPEMKRLPLPRLTPTDVAALSEAILGHTGKQKALLNLLQKETEGNAFFLVEIIRNLAEEAGQLAAIGRSELPEKLMPDGIQTIITRRLARVPTAAQPLLTQAAVAGRRLDLSLLRLLAPEIDLDLWWLPVCAEAAVLEVQGNQWQFSHNKLRDGLLDRLQPAQRQQHHGEVAAYLERLYGADANQAAQLAYHWGEAGESDKERHYTFMAAKHAMAQYANDEALTYLTHVLTLTPAADLVARYDVHLLREQLYHWVSARDEQAAEIEILAQLALTLDDIDRQVKVSLRHANYAFVTSQPEIAIKAAQEAITLSATRAEPSSDTAAGHLILGETLNYMGRFVEATAILQQGLAISQQTDSPEQTAAIFRVLASISCIQLGEYEQAEHYCQAGLELARQTGNRWQEGKLLNIWGIHAGIQLLNETALARFEESLAISREIGDRRGERSTLGNLGLVALNQRFYDQAREYLTANLAITHEIRDQKGAATTMTNLGECLLAYGAYEEAEAVLLEGLAFSQAIQYHACMCSILHGLSTVAIQTKNYPLAERYATEALTLVRELGLPAREGENLNALGWSVLSQGDCENAQKYYQQALDNSIEYKPSNVWLNQAALARIAAELGQDPEPYLSQVLQFQQQDNRLSAIEFPGLVYLHLYKTLHRLQHPQAEAVLTQAVQFLQEMAGKIKDEATRQSLLENVPEYRELRQLYE